MRGRETVGLRLGLLILTAIFAGMVVCGCGQKTVRHSGGRPSKPGPRSGKSYVIQGKRYHILASARGYEEEGVASWYGRDFHGKKTAGGERYNMHDMTAAHKTLPLNTWVRVTNLANFREVTVRVNDRGPFARGRIIDLSYAAAGSIGMVSSGTAPVRVLALGRAEERRVDGRVETVLVQPKSYTTGRFTVQVASFQDKSNALALAGRLRREFGSAAIQTFDRGDAIFYRVHVGSKPTLGEAVAVQSMLEKRGFSDCFVVAR